MVGLNPHIDVAVGLIVRGDQIFIAQRAPENSHGGFWEFPGGKVELGEDPYRALCRELQEEVDITVQAADLVQTVDHNYETRAVTLHVFRVTAFLGEPKGHEGQPVQWVTAPILKTLPFPGANLSIVETVISFLR